MKQKLLYKLLNFLRFKIADSARYSNVLDDHSLNSRKDLYISGSEIHGNVQIGQGVKIYQTYINGNIIIGRYTSIWGPDASIIAKVNKIIIGNFSSIARNTSIQEVMHRSDCATTYHIFQNFFKEKRNDEFVSKGDIVIGNDVWIGANAIVLSGVTVGDGSIVAAGAVVTKDVPPYSIVAGNPAKVVKYRFSEEIVAALGQVKWWDWPDEKLKRNRSFFEGKLTLDKIKDIKD